MKRSFLFMAVGAALAAALLAGSDGIRWAWAAGQRVHVREFGGATVTIGQQTSANSMPVVGASDWTLATSAAAANLDTVAHTTVACDDTGAVAFTSNAADVIVWVKNASTTQDVFINFGTAGAPDRTDPTTYNLRLGADAGSGTAEVVALPAGFGASFECDAAAAANLIVTALRES